MIGLDIGSKFIKICYVDKTDAGWRVRAALMSGTPAVMEEEKQDSATAARIKAILQEGFPSARRVASSLNGSQILARNFTFPNLTDEELEGAIKLEAGQSVFADLDAMYTDFQPVAREGNKIEVIFAAALREMVERHLQVIGEAGLEAAVIDTDSFALANCFAAFEPGYDTQSVALLNIGHTYTNIAVMDGGKLRFVRNINFGGKDVSAGIASYFNIYPEMAEDIKRHPELWDEIGLNIKNVLRRSMPDLFEAVYRSIEYCMNRKKLINIDKILLTGGSSTLQGMDTFLAEVLGIPTEKWNPLDRVEISGTCRQDLGQFMTIALGLALRKVKHA